MRVWRFFFLFIIYFFYSYQAARLGTQILVFWSHAPFENPKAEDPLLLNTRRNLNPGVQWNSYAHGLCCRPLDSKNLRLKLSFKPFASFWTPVERLP